uniref:Uncharacterized protein n=1 Tax=Meloidogyne enterolobii TaxID=390850 RepID=A0A6V7U3N5_MELEN|nr:unnamed protein product [Meloidogyne enterolobii]
MKFWSFQHRRPQILDIVNILIEMELKNLVRIYLKNLLQLHNFPN